MCQKRERCTVLLMAAGSGLRMGGVVVPEGDQEYCREIVETCGLAGKVRKIVAGGRERCFSVHNGLQAVDWPCDYVFIHDSARPFIDDDTMERLLDEVRISKACIAAVPVPTKDTVKIADQDGFVAQTPNRKDVWLVQTPQVFDFELIKEAHEKMVVRYDELLKKGVIITDDAMVAETFSGYRVKLVMANYRNIKVTTPEDMDTVAAYMKGRH